MISYKRDVLERQRLSEVKLGRGSSICERVRKKIVEYFKNKVPQCQIAKALQISPSTVHNIIKRFRETGEISVHKGRGWRPLLDAICRCQLKLYHAKRKPYVNMVQKRRRVLWAKAHLKGTVSKWKSVLRRVQIWHSCWKSRTPCPPG